MNYFEVSQQKGQELFNNIKKNLPELKELFAKINDHWAYEDLMYRYYHQSFKVYWIQEYTKQIVDFLMKMCPAKPEDEEYKDTSMCEMNSDFKRIYEAGQGIVFKSSHNKDWDKYTRPQLEAFLHAKYFLEMAIKYGEQLKEAPQYLPSGWAGVLYFYNLR
jgi:hypothetical protein